MENFTEVYERIETELIADNPDIRSQYLNHFGNEISEFSKAMSHAFLSWRGLDDDEVKGDEKKAFVSALVNSAILLHILSMKLFLSGNLVPAGNLERQVIETIALACLCSGKDLGILERYMESRYSTNDAVKHVLHHAKKLRLEKDALKVLAQTRDVYNKFSHPNLLTLALLRPFSEKGVLQLGAFFDKGKLDQYRKEVIARLNIAKVFSNVLTGVKANISAW